MTILFMLVVALVLLMVWGSTVGNDAMPFSGPGGFHGGDRDLVDESRTWYARVGPGRVLCRSCGRLFKEHPDGSLVEDRDA